MSLRVSMVRFLPVVVAGASAAFVALAATSSWGASPPDPQTAAGSAGAGSHQAASTPATRPDVEPATVSASAVGTVAVPPGFPSASDTGVPTGTRLTRLSGQLTVKVPGTVVSDIELDGCVRVGAPRVIIRDSIIRCSHAVPVIDIGGTAAGTSLIDLTIDGEGVATAGVQGKLFTARALNVYGTGDGIHLGAGATVEGSYIHDLARQSWLHHDDLQTAAGADASDIRVVGNTLLDYSSRSNGNSVYHAGTGEISNIVFTRNFVDGGTFSIQVGNGRNQHALSFTQNSFGRHFHYGILALSDPSGTAVSFVDNVWQGTGRAATPKNSRGYGLTG